MGVVDFAEVEVSMAVASTVADFAVADMAGGVSAIRKASSVTPVADLMVASE